MRRLVVFNLVSLDGYIADQNGDMSWAHRQDPEWNTFVTGNARGEGALLFGRVTYEMMASWWPTPQAIQAMPAAAEWMNNAPKLVVSRTLKKATWNNTTLLKGDLVPALTKLKKESGPDFVVFGSGTVIAQLAEHGMIDEYQVVVNPIVLGRGKSMFDGVTRRMNLKLTRTRIFGNGNALLCYEPM
jgi:dihydrofolate reductase